MMKNPIIHVEVIGGNASALQDFYRDAFPWRFGPPSPHALADMQYRIAFPEARASLSASAAMCVTVCRAT
jgi:predicted enzyme related to lactoylglutathione lyase